MGLWCFVVVSSHLLLQATPNKTQRTDRDALLIPPEDPKPLQNELFFEADSLFEQNKFLLALAAYRKILQDDALLQDPNNKLYLYNKLGRVNRVLDELDVAYDYFQKGLLMIKQIDGLNPSIIADRYYYLGRYFDRNSEPDSAMHYFALALEIRKANNNLKGEAEVYIGQGELHQFVYNNYEMAKSFYKKGIETLSEVNDAAKLQVNALYYMGTVMRISGDYQQAIIYINQAIKTYQDTNLTISSYLTNGYNGLGNIYYNLGEYEKAIDEYQKAIAITSKDSESSASLSNYYNNIGENYSMLGDYDTALNYFSKAQRLAGSAAIPLSNIFLNRAAVYRKLNFNDRALNLLKSTVKLRQTNPRLKDAIAIAQMNLADYFLAQGLPDSASIYCQKGIQTLTKSPLTSFKDNPQEGELIPGNTMQSLLSLKGKISMQLYERSREEKHLMLAVKTYRLLDIAIDLTRASYDLEGSKLFLADKTKEYYENALNASFTYYSQKKTDSLAQQLYHFIAKSKAILLIQGAREQDAQIEDQALLRLLLTEANIKSKMNFYQTRLEELKDKQSDERKIKVIEKAIFDLTTKKNNVEDSIRLTHGNYFLNRNKIELAELDALSQYATEKSTDIFEFFWGDDAVFLCKVNALDGSYSFFKLTQINDLLSKINQFRKLIFTNSKAGKRKENYVKFVETGAFIYTKLLKGYLEAPGKGELKKLKIIPDGPLVGIPFDALLKPSEINSHIDFKSLNYLLLEYIISYEYSSQIMIDNRQINRTPNPRLIGFSYAGADKSSVNGTRGVGPLHASYDEVKSILSQFDGDHYAGIQATETNFKHYSKDFDILHLALHGNSDEQNRFNSRLLFRLENETLEDGELYPFELGGLGLKASMAVLSACDTGSGKHQNGEGVYSMARGFVLANCPTVIQSYWAVDDNTSSEVMQFFYKHVKTGKDLDVALRLAKLDYLQSSDGILANPNNWAGFCVLGQSRGFTFSVLNLQSWFWVIGVVIVLFILVYRLKVATSS